MYTEINNQFSMTMAVYLSAVIKFVVTDTYFLLIKIAVPPKGLHTRGPELTHVIIADEPNTK